MEHMAGYFALSLNYIDLFPYLRENVSIVRGTS